MHCFVFIQVSNFSWRRHRCKETCSWISNWNDHNENRSSEVAVECLPVTLLILHRELVFFSPLALFHGSKVVFTNYSSHIRTSCTVVGAWQLHHESSGSGRPALVPLQFYCQDVCNLCPHVHERSKIFWMLSFTIRLLFKIGRWTGDSPIIRMGRGAETDSCSTIISRLLAAHWLHLHVVFNLNIFFMLLTSTHSIFDFAASAKLLLFFFSTGMTIY